MPDPSCDRCAASTRTEYYMIEDDLWAAAAPNDERALCLGCVEDAIGRRLTPNDFQDAPVNRWPVMKPDARQRSHLLGVPGFVLSDADIPRSWSPRFLDRLGLGRRYAYWINDPERANPTEPV
ncbi:hypothetical protein [Rubrivirga sp.]|uniref:hypothetical protein n=1 Tax=Rubrivirga sp. TaxID=1885344 RepID=UPI003C71DEDE